MWPSVALTCFILLLSAPNSFDLVIADPPFLSQECIEKTLTTVKLLARDKILFCSGLRGVFQPLQFYGGVTVCLLLQMSLLYVFFGSFLHSGAIVEPTLRAGLPTLSRCQFRPHHRNNLSNEFRCYSTYGGGSLGVDTE